MYVCIYKKKHGIYRVWYCLWFQASTRGPKTYQSYLWGMFYLDSGNHSSVIHISKLNQIVCLKGVQFIAWNYTSVRASQVAQWRRRRRRGFDPWVRKIPWSRKWQPTPVLLPGEFLRQRSLTGYSAWGGKELETTEWLNIHTYLSKAFKVLSSFPALIIFLKQVYFFTYK